MMPLRQRLRRVWPVLGLALAGPAVFATDPERGAQLYATPPAPGLLACLDCHSEDPLTLNFGNIFVGRNAPALIQRAVTGNTGGMGYFQAFYDAAALADIAAWLGNSPARVDFGEWPPGQASDERVVTVRAGSKAALPQLRLAVVGDFRLLDSDCPPTLPARGTCQARLVFEPGAPGEREGALLIAHDALPTPARVALRGRGRDRPPALARLRPERLDFGAVPVRAAAAAAAPGPVRGVQLANDSAEPLRIASLEPDPSLLVVGGSCLAGLVLSPGRRCELALRWRDPPSGPLSATLVVRHDGVGGRSELAVSGLGVAALAPRWSADVDRLVFAARPPGVRGEPQTVQLWHDGEQALAPARLEAGPSGFDIVGGTCRVGTPVPAGGRCTVELAHQAWHRGAASGELLVQGGSQGSEPGTTWRLPLQVQAAALAVMPPRLHWRSEPGQGVERQAWLVNRGDTSLTLGPLSLSGPDAADVLVQDPAGAPASPRAAACRAGLVMAPGSHCAVALRFMTHLEGARQAALRVQHDAGELRLALQGRVQTEPWVETDAVVLDFDAGGPSMQRVAVRNPSTRAIRWAGWQAVGEGAQAFTLGGSCLQQALLAPGMACELELALAGPAGPRTEASLPLVDRDAGVLALLALRPVAAASISAPPPPPAAAAWQALDAGPVAAVGGPPGRQRLRLGVAGADPVTLGPLLVDGAQGGDFVIDAASGCRSGLVLRRGENCELTLWFLPAQAGLRQARLRATAALPAGEQRLDLPLAGRATGPALGQAGLSPDPVRLVAQPAADPAAHTEASRPRQRVWLTNEGAAGLWLGAAEAAAAFPRRLDPAAPDADACPQAAPWLLLPGQSCSVDLQWDGSPAGAAGASWRWPVDDGAPPVQLDVIVVDAPAARLNRGAGFGLTPWSPWGEGAFLAAWLAWAAWAAWAKRRRQRPGGAGQAGSDRGEPR